MGSPATTGAAPAGQMPGIRQSANAAAASARNSVRTVSTSGHSCAASDCGGNAWAAAADIGAKPTARTQATPRAKAARPDAKSFLLIQFSVQFGDQRAGNQAGLALRLHIQRQARPPHCGKRPG
ncbi:hypothetical protein G6F50_016149 [Rhizopus delemar]|uniref:Uncharacterized protein n=1 Tax=Rhizopus delemar TaxID=936053 RepID=A0A9P7C2P0_9FUNG|nr:hypothetical protein G6F50_016149 [Rhizopus delemar]